MIGNLKKNYYQIDYKDRFFLILLALFPLSLIAGNLLINVFILLFSLSFIVNFKQNKFYLNNKIFYILIFFFISLLINLFFSQIPSNSILRIIKFLFIILFVIETLRIFNKYNLNDIINIFKIWSIILFIVLSDCLFEVIFGFNTLGFSTTLIGRVASFFGDELVAGAFVHGFALFFISFLILKKTNNFVVAVGIIAILIISFLIGERSNFIKLFVALIIFSTLAFRINFFYKAIILVSIIGFFAGILFFNQSYKARYYHEIKDLFKKNGIEIYLKNSQYGAHQNAAIKIFYEYPLFGVGVKNFRHESNKKKYENNEFKSTDVKQAPHPHQFHLEILSETGIFGYMSFIIFIGYSLFLSIKSYIKNKNLFQLSSILFVMTSLIPLLPSGSFLSTYNGGIFWLNFSIMLAFCKILKSKSGFFTI